MKLHVRPCPRCNSRRVRCQAQRGGEDIMDTWIECGDCGARTDAIEDAYSDPEGAAYLWNSGDLLPPKTAA